jgi:D-galactosamine 6-phosphate deaminase/isomerase
LGNPLLTLLDLGKAEKEARGLSHTPREIFQQPATWRNTYRYLSGKRQETAEFLKSTHIRDGEHAPTVFLIGAGTSDYVGRALTRLLRRKWRTEVWAVPSTDLLTDPGDHLHPDRDYLWISFSRSGDSSEGVAVLTKALAASPRVRHMVITCNPAGAMARLCESEPGRALAIVLDDAVNDRGLAMTSSFTNMVVAGQCLAHLEDLEHYGELLECVANAGSMAIEEGSEIASAVVASGFSRACFVGSGTLSAVADEAALKVLELTAGRVCAMSHSTLGFRHGPMSALDGNTLFVQFVSGSAPRKNYDLDLMKEIRAKNLGKLCVAVSPRPCAELHALVDRDLCLCLPESIDDLYRPPLDIVAGQLIGLFASIREGLEPDRPSPTGAISRVVAGVTIYS